MKKYFFYIIIILMSYNSAQALPNCKGDNYKQWTNCFGTYTNESGRVYTGEFGDLPGIRHGEGKSILNGTSFEGIYENDKGISGKITYPNGDSFEGKFNQKGNFEGKGKFIFYDGGYVIGTWIDHKLQGNGIMVDKNGNEKKVKFKDGKIIN
tara:strand:- start:688 stop:1143 length:456 start_codon:yes stop_codon:yes gene_type:complete